MTEESDNNSNDGFSISTYDEDNSNVSIPSKSYTGEELCHLVCQKCTISPLTAPLFGLATYNKNYQTPVYLWLSPNVKVEVPPLPPSGGKASKTAYVLRWRYKIPWKTSSLEVEEEDQSQLEYVFSKDVHAFQYIFNQCRYDFLNSLFATTRHDTKYREWSTGLGVLDATRLAKRKNLGLKDLQRQFSDLNMFIPNRVLERNFSLIQKQILKRKLKYDFWKSVEEHMKELVNHDAESIERAYVLQVLNESPMYGSETYVSTGLMGQRQELTIDTGREQRPELRIHLIDTSGVDPIDTIEIKSIETGLSLRCNSMSVGHTQTQRGRSITQSTTDSLLSSGQGHDSGSHLIAPTEHSDDEEESDLDPFQNDDDTWSVQLCMNYRVPEVYTFPTQGIAESFATCILGYYRLSVNWHSNLSADEQLQYPSLKFLKLSNSFGPVAYV